MIGPTLWKTLENYVKVNQEEVKTRRLEGDTVMYRCTLWILLVATGVTFVSSITTKWVSSMKLCKFNNYGPAKINDVLKKNVWIGEAKYQRQWGEVHLQITEEDKKRTCIGTDFPYGYCPSTEKCKFCDIRMSLRMHLSQFFSNWNMLVNLTSNINYIVADFRNIEELPEPDLCLLNNENFNKEYVSCKNENEDGCKSADNFSNLKIIIHANLSLESPKNGLMKSKGIQLHLNFVLVPLLLYTQAFLPI